MASAPGGVGGRRGASTGSAVAGRTRRRSRRAAGAPEYVERLLFLSTATRAWAARAIPDYQSVFVFDNDHPCVGADAPRAARARRRHLSESRRPTGVARVVCYTPQAQHHAGGAAGRRDRRAARRLARPVSRARRAARGPPRADLREQGRSGRRVEPASARADLRDELRVQDDRDRGRCQPAATTTSTAACFFRTSSRPSATTAAGSCSRARRRSRSFRTSPATPTSATSRRRTRMPAWRRCRRERCASWRGA